MSSSSIIFGHYRSSRRHVLRCAFVNWRDRATAELAAQAWANGLEIDGETVGVRWGRSKGASGGKPTKNAGPSSVPVPAS